MATKTPKAGAKAATKEPLFSVILETGGNEYKFKTDDLAHAILSLGIHSTNTETEITVKAGRKEVVRALKVADARRLFNNETAAIIFEKQVRLVLDARE